jgi:hypothetical protein
MLLAAPAQAATDELPQRFDDCRTQPTPTATAAAGPGVKTVIRESEIAPEDQAKYEAEYDRAIATRKTLPLQRKRELSAVIKQLESFARGGMLTTSRMPVLFDQLKRNTDWWGRSGPPISAAPAGSSRPCAGGNGTRTDRIIIGETVYQWYAGQGLQLQQLATFGRANALAKACTEPDPKGFKCDRDRFEVALDGIVATAVERGDFLAWEYYFSFGGGKAPWVSGLAQATAMQALVRGAKYFADARYLEVAKRALGVFKAKAPLGVRVDTDAGDHFLIYSFNPRLRVLNAFLQALVGIYDYAEAADDDEARALFAAGEREAQAEIPKHDTGAWSLYSMSTGSESDLGYHRLLRDFLTSLCDRTKTALYCDTAARFTGYLREKPRLSFTGKQPAGAAKFFLSKISCVTLTVTKNGRPVASASRVLGRGARQLGWRPPGKGRYVVRVLAEDLAGNKAAIRTTVRAR